MDNLVIFILFVFVLIFVLWMTLENNIDDIDVEAYYNYCGSCYGKTVGQCLQCVNCGFISKNGYGKCVEGDMYGPYDFNTEYIGARWINNDQYWTHILTSDDISIPTTYVYNYRYPYYRRWIGKSPGPGKFGRRRLVFNNLPKKLNKSEWNKINLNDQTNYLLNNSEYDPQNDIDNDFKIKNKFVDTTIGKAMAYES
jgi:hypothetical protein